MPRKIHPNSLKNLLKGQELTHRKGNKYFLGKKHTEKTKRKIRLAKLGKPTWSSMHRKEMGEKILGDKNPNWKGGIKNIQHPRCSSEIKQWRILVFTRDNWTCQVCGQVGKTLNVHHIKSWIKCPELRYEVDNGITLCLECHKLTDNYANRKFYNN